MKPHISARSSLFPVPIQIRNNVLEFGTESLHFSLARAILAFVTFGTIISAGIDALVECKTVQTVYAGTISAVSYTLANELQLHICSCRFHTRTCNWWLMKTIIPYLACSDCSTHPNLPPGDRLDSTLLFCPWERAHDGGRKASLSDCLPESTGSIEKSDASSNAVFSDAR